MNKLIMKQQRIVRKIEQAAKAALDDKNMKSFLHHSFRYAAIRLVVYPDAKPVGPGYLLDKLIEEEVFNSK